MLDMPFIMLSILPSQLLRALAIALLCISIANAADAQGRRVALVIGNGNYQQSVLPKLTNPLTMLKISARLYAVLALKSSREKT